MKKVNPKTYDIIGIAAGILLVLMCILAVVINNQPAVAGAAEIPDSAVTAEGTAMGRNGPITVSVTADENAIYQIEVLSHEETEGIGTVAATEMPGRIFDTQSLQCDMVSGATISSEAIVAAVADALKNAGLDPNVFMREVEAAAAVEKTPEELECDIVVVGAGGAGLTASVLATQQGADVILLEKMPFVGGNSLRAEGGMNAADTKVEAELGITDSTVDNFVEDTLRLGHDLANPDLVRTMAENSAEAVDWLYSIDAPLPEVVATGGTTHKYLHKPEGGLPVGEYLVEKLKTPAENLGIDVRVGTKST